jgi:hypothetical protein
MLRIALPSLLNKLNQERKKKGLERATYEEIHVATGIHRKILSRIINKPWENTSSEHIDLLAQYFFNELKPEGQKSPVDDYKFMQSIIAELVEIYPDGAPFELDLQLYKDEEGRFKTGFEAFWTVLMQSERYKEMRVKWWEREKQAKAREEAHKKSTNQVVNAAKKLRKRIS